MMSLKSSLPLITLFFFTAACPMKVATNLDSAAYYDDVTALEQPIIAEPDINATDSSGNSLLYLATLEGNLDRVRFLLKNGADVNMQNQRGDAPIHIAAMFGHTKILQKLINTPGCNLNLYGENGNTPL